ncbi:MAG: hypothetical protein GY768_02615 [Planctomycetaceae bacterium]|nr:hypothetical protein [Planctomycetaceae bacterium]
MMAENVLTTIQERTRVTLLKRATCLFTVALLLSTWKLWFPQSAFPQVPLFQGLVDVPGWVDQGLLLVLVPALILMGVVRVSPRFATISLFLIIGLLTTLMMLNQHRIQPWAYLAILVFTTIACCTAKQILFWLRALFLSVYLFSALSKFDYLFLTTIGQQFLSTGLESLGFAFLEWSEPTRIGFALLLPLGELLTAICLLFSNTRRLGVIMALFLHLTLVLILGPWGMQQKVAVLIWNLQFCILIPLIFWPLNRVALDPISEGGQLTRSGMVGSVGARLLICLAICFPLFEGLGFWDSWVSWGLYSTRAARVEIYFQEELAKRLPPELQPHLSQSTYQGYLKKFYMDRWSLAALDAPIYPSDRFGTGAVLALLEQLQITKGVVMVHSSIPARRTGSRNQERIREVDAMVRFPARYRLNAKPRQGFLLSPDRK